MSTVVRFSVSTLSLAEPCVDAWSGRFHRLMRSNSLVLKSTIFPPWYRETIQPWCGFFTHPCATLIHFQVPLRARADRLQRVRPLLRASNRAHIAQPIRHHELFCWRPRWQKRARRFRRTYCCSGKAVDRRALPQRGPASLCVRSALSLVLVSQPRRQCA